eukprot:g23052.t1
MGRCCTFDDCRGRCRRAVGWCGGEGRVDQLVLEGMVPAEGGQGKGGEYVSDGGISLEVTEVASDDLLDVDAGGMVVPAASYLPRTCNPFTCPFPTRRGLRTLRFFLHQRPELSPPTTTPFCLAELNLTLNNFSLNSSHFPQ